MPDTCLTLHFSKPKSQVQPYQGPPSDPEIIDSPEQRKKKKRPSSRAASLVAGAKPQPSGAKSDLLGG